MPTEFLAFQQSHLIAADVLRSEMVESLPGLAAELLDRDQVRADRRLGVVAAYEFLSHPLGEYGHRDLLSLRPTLSPAPYRYTAKPSAAPAASFQSPSVYRPVGLPKSVLGQENVLDLYRM